MSRPKSVRTIGKYATLLQRFPRFRLAFSLPLPDAVLESLGLSEQPAIGDSFIPASIGKPLNSMPTGKSSYVVIFRK